MYLDDLLLVADELARAGWAEANAGNVSVRLPDEALAELPLGPGGPWTPLARPVPELAGEHMLVTARGCQMRLVSRRPQRDCGVLELSGDGAAWRVRWGLEGTTPTSELPSHLLSHAVRKARSGGAERVILHTHPPALIALCHVRAWDTRSLNQLLWSLHPEGVCLFPGALAYLPFAIPGSVEIAEQTCAAFAEHAMVLWEYHGVFASAPTADAAFGMVQAAEKAAVIYRDACAMGGVRRGLSPAQIRQVAASLGITPAPGILGEEDGSHAV